MTEINDHIKHVVERNTRRLLERLANKTASRAQRKIEAARAAITEIDAIVAQVDDVEHIARIVQLADSTDDAARDLETQIAKAKRAASLYEERASTLVATITSTLAQGAD